MYQQSRIISIMICQRPDQELVAGDFFIFVTVLIVHDVTCTIVMDAIITHDCQQSWLLRPLLKNTSFMSN